MRFSLDYKIINFVNLERKTEITRYRKGEYFVIFKTSPFLFVWINFWELVILHIT